MIVQDPARRYRCTMFTGIVRELGRVASVEPRGDTLRLVVESGTDAAVGDSVAISGVCLTVVERGGGRLAFDAVPETLERTSLGRLGPGDRVNLEPALRAGEPLGGHIVQGHVDGVATVRSVGDPTWFDLPPELLRYVVEKGSITLDGCSLTIADLDDRGVAVAFIPHTLAVTTFGQAAPGDPVNVEVDVLARYVERLTTMSG
jgi:riboflavin synthase